MDRNSLFIIIIIVLLNSCYNDNERVAYYGNGNLMFIERIKDGKKNGEAIYYDSLGNVVLKGSFKNDLEDGLFEKYRNGKLYMKGHYKMGKSDGKTYDYKEGKLDIYSIYRNDSIQYIRTYDSLGNISSEAYFKNEKRNGPFKIYKNGKMALSGNCYNDKMVGNVIYYDENGKTVKVVPAK